MTWWLKARRVHTHLPAGLRLFFLLAAVVQDGPVHLPSISLGTSEGVQALIFVPLVPAAILSHTPAGTAEGRSAGGAYTALLQSL
ncbi:hypothetical protein [Streptomyces sp. NPDC054794]